jgi:hypothetical protein
MRSRISEDYISNRAWFRDVIGGTGLILRGVSALEFLQLFVGYAGEQEIDVYAMSKGQYENIGYHVVDTFDGLDVVRFGNVLCSSVSQAINDMLCDENADDQALTEALSKYYYSHDEMFEGLSIKPENIERFNNVKEWAIQYFCAG